VGRTLTRFIYEFETESQENSVISIDIFVFFTVLHIHNLDFIVRSSSNFSRDSLKSSKLVTSQSHQNPVEFW